MGKRLVEPAGFSLRHFEIDAVADKIDSSLKRLEAATAIFYNKPIAFRVKNGPWVELTAEHQAGGIHPLNPETDGSYVYEWELVENL